VIISAEFVVNSKVYSIIKMFLFMANYRRELKMGVDIEKKKMEKATEIIERMNKI